MQILKWILGIVAILIAAVLIASFTLRPGAYEQVVAEPGETGVRINENGLLANYFPSPSKEKAPAILLLGGSEGGLGSFTTRTATVLQNEGYSVLQIAYYSAPGKPSDLVEIPLETFDQGLAWLKQKPNVDPDNIAIYGFSKGGEASLLYASLRPEIKAVVAAVPSSVVWAGIDWTIAGMVGLKSMRSSWTEKGEPLPFMPFGNYEDTILSTYANGLKSQDNYPDAFIKVENIQGPIMLICGDKDLLWPSCPMSRQVKLRAESKNGPTVRLLAYEDAGHNVGGPPVENFTSEPDEESGSGGTHSANHEAEIDGWPKILAFLSNAFVQDS